MTAPAADEFDGWFADSETFPTRDRLRAEALGLPRGVSSDSLLPWSGLEQIAAALRLQPGERLVDLACGRGSYGIEVARRSGAALVGVDFSRYAVGVARDRAARVGISAEFVVGLLTATRREAGSAEAAMCVDAVQYADPPLEGLREARRLLVSGGRLVVTCWEAVDPDDEEVPPRLARIDLARDLAEAGFTDVVVSEQPGWRTVERALWESAQAVDTAGDPALEAMQQEGRRVLARFDRVRRVLATAVAP